MVNKSIVQAQLAVAIQWPSLFKDRSRGYCKYCILFGKAAYLISNFTGTLITSHLTNLQKASEELHEHFTGLGSSTARTYLAAIETKEHFKNSKQLPINQQPPSILARHVSEKREILT